MTKTVCQFSSNDQLEIFQVKNKPVVVAKTGVTVSSNAGFLAMGKINREIGLIPSVIGCFQDAQRNRAKAPERIKHSLEELLSQRVFQMALGYEDGLDANELRDDSLLQLSVGKEGALGSQPMMSRLENWVSVKDIYRAWRELIKVYVREFHEFGRPVVLQIDSTDDPCHGQLGLFNGYYREHCFHPLLITEERSSFPFGIIFRDGNVGSAHQSKVLLKRLIKWLREEIKGVKIVIKGDCSFGIADLVNWFDEIEVDYVIGVSGNKVLYKNIKDLQSEVLSAYEQDGIKSQRFMSLSYRAGTWLKDHSVVAKVEHTGKGINRRFVVSSMYPEDPGELYQTYHRRAKGIEAIIEQLKNGLRFDKTACYKKLPNQMRYFESALALILHLKLMDKLASKLPNFPTVQTLIQKVLKVAGIITISVRRYFIKLSTADPNSALLMHALQS